MDLREFKPGGNGSLEGLAEVEIDALERDSGGVDLMTELKKGRKEIRQATIDVLTGLAKRLIINIKIAEVKHGLGLDICDPQQEQDFTEGMIALFDGKLPEAYVREICGPAIEYGKQAMVAYLEEKYGDRQSN